jgi:hypothetical protein
MFSQGFLVDLFANLQKVKREKSKNISQCTIFFNVQHYLEKLFLFFHLPQIRVEKTRF